LPTSLRLNSELDKRLKPGGISSSFHIDLTNGINDEIILNNTPRISHYFFDINEDSISLPELSNYKHYVVTGGGGRFSISNLPQADQITLGQYSTCLNLAEKNIISNQGLIILMLTGTQRRPDAGLYSGPPFPYLRLEIEYTNAEVNEVVNQLISNPNTPIAYWDDAHNGSRAWSISSQGNAKTYFLGLNQENSNIKNIFYSGNFRDYKFNKKSNYNYSGIDRYEIKTKTNVDSITGLSTLKFADQEIDFQEDIIGVFDQVTGLNTDSGKMFRLYNAAFARFPDADGLRYWIGNFSSGIDDERAVSSSFLASAEFKERYGSNISHEQYVETLYLNVLNRELDQGGYDYWVGNLNNGVEQRHEVLLGFSESAENKLLFTDMTGFG